MVLSSIFLFNEKEKEINEKEKGARYRLLFKNKRFNEFHQRQKR
jgi:hypothetical protein